MTDNEIIKGLECCICDECEDCPHDEETACVENLHQEALDLINRQKAEIDELSEKLNATIAGQETLQEYIAQRSPLGMAGEG